MAEKSLTVGKSIAVGEKFTFRQNSQIFNHRDARSIVNLFKFYFVHQRLHQSQTPAAPSFVGFYFLRFFVGKPQAAVGNCDNDFVIFNRKFLIDFAVRTVGMFRRIDTGFDQSSLDLIDFGGK